MVTNNYMRQCAHTGMLQTHKTGDLRRSMRLWIWMAVAMLCLVLQPLALRAQVTGEGSIEGTVTDKTGAVIPGATITTVNDATHAVKIGASDSSGLFVVSPLLPGNYQVTIDAKGFQTEVQDNLDVTPLNITAFNPVMSIGMASQTVTVTTAPPMLDVDSATYGAVVEHSTYSALPLFVSPTQERDPTAFYTLVQGTTNDKVNGRLPVLSGAAPHMAELYLDGVPTTTINQIGDNRLVALNVDVDAVDQFQIIDRKSVV